MSMFGPVDGPHVSPRDGKEDFIAAEHVIPERALANEALLHDAVADPSTGLPRWVWFAVAAVVAVLVVVVVASAGR